MREKLIKNLWTLKKEPIVNCCCNFYSWITKPQAIFDTAAKIKIILVMESLS